MICCEPDADFACNFSVSTVRLPSVGSIDHRHKRLEICWCCHDNWFRGIQSDASVVRE